MTNKFFNKRIGSWAVSILENMFFGFFSRIRERIIEILEEIPNNSAKLVYGICLLIFIVVTGAAGAVILPASLIIILVQYSGPDVDKVLLAGQCLFFLGFFYLVVSVVLISIVGKNVKGSLEKITRKLVRKLDK